jgi:hypothetical protein
VISSADAVRQVIALVENSALSQKVKQQLMKELEEAVESFQNGRFKKAVGALERFQQKVETQVSRQNPALAALLTEAAQKILQVQTPSRLTVSQEKRGGPLRLSFVPDDACDFTIEYSTNLIDWAPLTKSLRINAREVLDQDGPKAGQRFYRAVVGHCE